MLLKMFHYLTANYRCCFVFLFIHFQIITSNTAQDLLPDELIPELYLKYKEAVSDDNTTSSARRFFKNDKLYEVHVRRLKEVNGFKVHNLMIREKEEDNKDKLIYINNPVESKIPRAYLTLEEFKNALIMRAQAHKDILSSDTSNLVRTNSVTTKRESIKKFSTVFHPKLLSLFVSNQTVSSKGTEEHLMGNSVKETTKYLLTKPDITIGTTESFKNQIKENITLNAETDVETTTFHTATTNIDVLSNKTLVNKLINITTTINDPATSLDQTSPKENWVTLTETTEKKTPKRLKVFRVSNAPEKEIIRRELEGTTSIRYLNGTKLFETSEQLIAEDNKRTTSSSVSTNSNVLSNNTKFMNITTILRDQTSGEENSSKVSVVTKKTPKRLKVSGVYKATKKIATTTTKRKRSTLARPLVFMGGL